MDTLRPEPLVRLKNLSKQYEQGGWFARRRFRIPALEEVNLEIDAGATLALVGESGSGKSTLARCLARLEESSGGEIWFEGANILTLSGEPLRLLRRRIQLVFQDAASALNPRLTALEIVAEPLAVQGWGTRKARRERARELMEQVGLPAAAGEWGKRLPLELSGGQRQRLALARALALEPRLLILDEALAGLDLSIQAQILNLLLELQAAHSLTYLYISHDLNLVSRFADQVAVLHRGKIVELSTAAELFAHPKSFHTRALLESALASPPVPVELQSSPRGW